VGFKSNVRRDLEGGGDDDHPPKPTPRFGVGRKEETMWFVRADQIVQLERHLNRAWTMVKRKEDAFVSTNQRDGATGRQHSLRP
jgi:hypothetical protein